MGRSRWIAWVALGLALAFLPLACTEESNPVGFDQGRRDTSLSEPESLLITEPSADIEGRPVRSTGTSISLLIGADSLMRSVALIRFDALPDTSQLAVVELQLHAKQGRGEAIWLRTFEVTGGPEAWDASEVTWATRPDTLTEPLSETFVPVRTSAIEAADFDTIPRIPIPLDLIRRWKRDPESNGGIQICIGPGQESGQTETGIARVVSHNDKIYDSSGNEIMTPALVFIDSTGVEIGSLEATTDAYIYQDVRPAVSGLDSTIRISAGPPSRYHLRFDLDPIPTDAIIVRAVMSIPLADGESIGADGITMSVYQTTESWTEENLPDSLSLGSSSVTVESFSDTTATSLDFDLGGLVQDWIEGEENDGVTVRLSDETAVPMEIRLLTRESSRKPSLRIVYSMPLDFRWGADP